MIDESIKRTFMDCYEKSYLDEDVLQFLIKDSMGSPLYESIGNHKVSGDKLISIIIPTHNRKKQLEQCVYSILNQSYDNFEIIIIDDDSKDDTEKMFSNCKNKRIKYFKNKKNQGVGCNRQKGYSLSNGDYIIFMDDDDYYLDFDYFSKCIKIFEENNNINTICSNTIIHIEENNEYLPHILNMQESVNSIEYLEKFQIHNNKPTSTFPLIMRKTSMEKVNFNEMKMVNDSSIYLRVLMAGGETYFNKKIIGVYRVHSNNITKTPDVDFVIHNLHEKKNIYEYVNQHQLLKKANNWYEKQIMITINYLLSGSKLNRYQVTIVSKWLKKNVSTKMCLKFLIKVIKKGVSR